MASAVALPVFKMVAIKDPVCSPQRSVARCEGLKLFSSQKRNIVWSVRHSPSRGRLHISCAKADSATVETVKNVICKQLAMEVKDVLPDSKFADLGADSLDTVEIIMALEEQFEICLSQDGAEKIATVQDAADLIHEIKTSSTA